MTTVSNDVQSPPEIVDRSPDTPLQKPATASVKTRFQVARRLFRNRTFVLSFALLMLFVIAAILTPLIAMHDPDKVNVQSRLQGPSVAHWLGTDSLGRDLYARLLYGAGVTMRACILAVGIAAVIGIPLGLVAGYVRGWVDEVLSTLNDTLMSMPGLLFALAIITALGPGLTNAMIAIGLIQAPGFYRISRAAAISVRNSTYVEAARSLGCSGPRLVFRHVLPNTAGPLLVVVTFGFSLTIVAEATLSFLGLGVQPPSASWGSLTREAFNQVRYSSWGIVPPIVAITLVVVSIALIGDAIQEAIGPQAGGRR